MITNDDLIYDERVTSKKTGVLFLALTILFLVLFIWRVIAGGLDIPAAVFLCLFVFFLFYSVNYRTLVIRLTAESLKLTSGIFTWTVVLVNLKGDHLSIEKGPTWPTPPDSVNRNQRRLARNGA